MNSFEYNPQIEELGYFDLVEQIENDPYIHENDVYDYDDQTFSDYLSSGNDF